MFKRIARDVLIAFGLLALWASTSRTFMQYVSEKRDVNKWWGSYQYMRDGDLVNLSYLDFVKKFQPPPRPAGFIRPTYNGPSNTVLYMYGDSHTWHLDDTDFAGLCGFHYLQRIHGGYYHLDTTKRNVLIVEISEHYLRSYFEDTRMIREFYDSSGKNESTACNSGKNTANKKYSTPIPDVQLSCLFNKNINQNLQCNLFNYLFVMPMFEYKAALNYYLFNRASGDVVISDDRNYLFLKETVSHDDVGSSYEILPADVVPTVVNNLNLISDHYKREGFREVYFSFIPNTATILQPNGYNSLIPSIEHDPNLRAQIIDAYNVFKNATELCFLPGDTHWNHKGKQLWIDEVNKVLIAGK